MKCPACAHEFEVDLLGEPQRPKNSVQQFLASYVDAFRVAYKTDPVIGGRVAATAKRIVDALGAEKSKRYAWAYLAMKDSFFVTRQHDLMTMEANLNKIAVFAETGSTTSQGQARQADAMAGSINAVKGYLEKKHGG